VVDGVRRRFGEQIRAELGDHPYTDVRRSELRLLLLVPAAGATLTTLADLTGVTKQSLSEFVDGLRRAGYVTTEVDPDDRRVKLIRPTARGEAAQRDVLAASRAVEDAWRATIGPTRFDSMKRVLVELAELRQPE
jgi:DNA-binding MarR family transcriptional regulator